MLDLTIFTIYGLTLAHYCISTLLDPDQDRSIVDTVFAILLPMGSIGGVILYATLPEGNGTAAWLYIPLMLLALASIAWEMKDVLFENTQLTIVKFVFGFLLLQSLFGPGLYLGWLWLRVSLA